MLWLMWLACTGAPEDTGELAVEGELTTLTYNVQGLPDAITGNHTAGRMPRIAPLLNDYALVGLQEDFDEANHEALVAEAEHPVQLWFSEAVDEGRVYGSGLTLLAPGTLLSYEQVHYSSCNGVVDGASDCLASKGFQVALLQIGAAEIAVYNTHMEAGGGDADDAVRGEQVAEVLAHIAVHAAEHPVIFMGDTNLKDEDAADLVFVDELKAAGLVDSCDATACPEPGRIDRVMIRDGGGVTLEATNWEVPDGFIGDTGAPLSDHDAIAVTLRWTVD